MARGERKAPQRAKTAFFVVDVFEHFYLKERPKAQRVAETTLQESKYFSI